MTVLLGVALLDSSNPDPGEVSYLDKQGQRSSGSVHDILVVVDPADPAGRELARFASANLWTASRRRTDTVPYDVAFGVVVPTDAGLRDRSEAWSFVEPPTTDRRHFARVGGAYRSDRVAAPPARIRRCSARCAHHSTSPGATAHAARSH